MPKPLASPMVAQAVARLVQAMHAAYPEIATEGVRPKSPGLFVGDIAGQRVHLAPGKRSSQLFLMRYAERGRMSYFHHGFSLLKKGVVPRWKSADDEVRLILWLTNAAVELEEMARD